MIGPGKYDGEATLVMERVKARGVIVIVIGGEKGSGMTAKADYDLQADFVTTTRLPEMLRNIANRNRHKDGRLGEMKREDAKAEVARVHALSTIMAQYFAGQEPGVIGSVIAELMSNFLLCHRIPNDPARTAKLRDDILKEWLDTVHQLVAVNEAEGTRVQ